LIQKAAQLGVIVLIKRRLESKITWNKSPEKVTNSFNFYQLSSEFVTNKAFLGITFGEWGRENILALN
jgi:hypothetical protein